MTLTTDPNLIPKPKVALTPDMQWLFNRLGWSEQTHDAVLSQYWIYTHLKFMTIKGSEHAWCAMVDAAAQWENGFDPPMSAAAAALIGWKTRCEPQTNADIALKHSSGPLVGHYHRTRFYALAEDPRFFWGLGGNQSDMICFSLYPMGDIVWSCMPVLKKLDDTIGNGEKDDQA